MLRDILSMKVMYRFHDSTILPREFYGSSNSTILPENYYESDVPILPILPQEFYESDVPYLRFFDFLQWMKERGKFVVLMYSYYVITFMTIL